MKNVFDYNDKHWDEASDQRLTLREEGSPTRAYITISQVSLDQAGSKLISGCKRKSGSRGTAQGAGTRTRFAWQVVPPKSRPDARGLTLISCIDLAPTSTLIPYSFML